MSNFKKLHGNPSRMSMVHEYENGPLPGLKLPLQSPLAEAVTALLATKVFVIERVMNVQELADPGP